MRRLQVGIGLVDRIAIPVIVKRVDLVAVGLAHTPGPGGSLGAIFVDVVAVVEDEIEALGGDLLIRREVAVS